MQGIYTVTVSAPGFASLTSALVFVLDTSLDNETEDGFYFRTLGDVSVVRGSDCVKSLQATEINFMYKYAILCIQ